MRTEEFFERATQAFEVLGVLSMVVGFVFAFALSIVTWKRTGSGGRAFKTLRESLGGAILLGLELLVAADIVKTVTSTPSLTDAAVLGMIVADPDGAEFHDRDRDRRCPTVAEGVDHRPGSAGQRGSQVHAIGARPRHLAQSTPERIRSAAFSPISTLGAWVCPRMIVGITDASATRSPSTPRTRNCGSTTLASSPPIRQVPTG